MALFLDFLLCAVPIGFTFLYGAAGEIIVEKAGHLNLGIPGIMCMGGAGGCLALSLMYGSSIPPALVVILSILVSFLTGVLMGGLYGLLTITLRSNQNVTGLVMTIFGTALMYFIMDGIPGEEYLYALKFFRAPFHNSTSSLQYCGSMVGLALVIAVVAAWVLARTRVGLNLRAVGENPATADAVGINVTLYKYVATGVGCGIAALGGLFYIIDCSGTSEAYKTIEPMGWIAVALVIFTLWKPLITIGGAFIFGALYILNSYLPTLFPDVFIGNVGLELSPLLKMIPYVVTIVVLIVTSIRNKKENQAPAGLGLPYFREER
ncbi:MAG: ABC transporter permease [Clostridia bacterium]|nr:ABC transporter permease [Clostridia bacterium]